MVDQERGGPDEAEFRFETQIVENGYLYWRSRLRDGLLPARGDIRPEEIPRLLPHVLMLDVRRTPDWDFRYRLIGTHLVDHFFRDYTGSWFSEIDHQRAPSKVWSNCRTVAETGRPLHPNTEYVGPHQGFRRCEDVILPLAADGTAVDTLLVFIAFLSRA